MLPTRKSMPRSSRQSDYKKTSRPPKRCKLQWYGHVSRSSGLAKNHLTRHSERGKKTRQTEEEMGRQHQGMDRPGVIQIPEGRGEQEKWIKLVVRSSVVPLWRSLPEGLQVQQAAAAAAGWTDDWAGNCIITSSLHSHKWMFYAISEMMVIPISTSEKNDC